VIRPTAHIVTALSVLMFLAGPSHAAEMIKCKIRYDLEGWSIFYRRGTGSGRITCSNGQTADVGIVAHGGGVSFGTQKVIDGIGTFSSVADISELYGRYAEAGVHAGAGPSADARVVVKGNVSLSLAATGQGINLGIALGSFNIQPK